MTNQYNPDDLNVLWGRIEALLGTNKLGALRQSPPRNDAFCTAVDAAIKANGCDPLKVPDAQIIGALEIAQEVWPLEAEAAATAFAEQAQGD
jgi:hypothetical protein